DRAMTSRRSGLGALVAVCALVVSCSSGLQAPVAGLGPELADKVTIDGVYGHLGKFQEIADANDGNRADGSPGYQASVDYVAQLLRDKGFDVQTPEFQRL